MIKLIHYLGWATELLHDKIEDVFMLSLFGVMVHR